MNICTAYYGDHRRGCWKRLVQLLNHITSCGHQVTLFVSQPVENIGSLNGLAIIVLPVKARNTILGILFFAIAVAKSSYQKYRSTCIERLIAFDCHNALGLLLIKIIKSVPLIVFIRGLYIHQDLFRGQYKLGSVCAGYLNKLAYLLADRVHFVSEVAMRDTINHFGLKRRNSIVIRNNIEPFVPQIANKTHKEDSLYIVGYLGQIVPRKNIRFLIDAVAACTASNVRLIIQGCGASKPELVAYAESLSLGEKIIFWEWDDDISIFFDSIGIFVLPSLYDDLSNSLVEAIGRDKIVFASARGGNQEVLGHNHHLLFCPQAGQSELAGRIDRIQTDQHYCDAIRRHLEKCKENLTFNWGERMRRAALIR